MGDMAEVFQAMKEHNKKSKASTQDRNIERLNEYGVKFEVKGAGCLKLVSSKFKTVMFYPSTSQFVWYDKKGVMKRSRRPKLKNKLIQLGCIKSTEGNDNV